MYNIYHVFRSTNQNINYKWNGWKTYTYVHIISHNVTAYMYIICAYAYISFMFECQRLVDILPRFQVSSKRQQQAKWQPPGNMLQLRSEKWNFPFPFPFFIVFLIFCTCLLWRVICTDWLYTTFVLLYVLVYASINNKVHLTAIYFAFVAVVVFLLFGNCHNNLLLCAINTRSFICYVCL